MVCDVVPQTHPASPPRLVSAKFALIVVSGFAYFVMIGAMVPVVPRYVEDELGGGGLQVGIAVGAFAVSAALIRPWVGRMGDTRGRRVLVVGGGVLASASLLLYPVATSLPLLVAARLVSGLGEAAFFTGVMTASQDLAPPDRRGEATSYFSVAIYGGLAFGPALGEALLRETSFTTVFLVFAACGFGAAVLGVGTPTGVTVDAVPDRDLLYRAALGPGFVLALGLVPMVAYGAFLPLYADEVGMDDVGPAFTVFAGLVLVVRIVGARLPDALGWRRTSTVALSAVAAGMLILGAWPSAAAVWVATVALAAGMSLLYPALFTAVMGVTPDTERSHAVGTFSLFFDLSSGFGAAIVGAVVAVSNQRVGFAAAGLCAAAGLVAQTSLRRRLAERPAT